MQHAEETILRTVHAALADAKTAWTAKTSPTRSLPPEILAGCFLFLPLSALISASCVSRAWRETAVSHHTLWTDIGVAISKPEDIHMIALAMRNSGILHLDLCISGTLGQGAARVLSRHVLRNIHRTRTLAYDARLSLNLSDIQAPVLTTIFATGEGVSL